MLVWIIVKPDNSYAIYIVQSQYLQRDIVLHTKITIYKRRLLIGFVAKFLSGYQAFNFRFYDITIIQKYPLINGQEIIFVEYNHQCHNNCLERSRFVSQRVKRFMWIFLNTLRPKQNGRHIPDDIFKWIFVNENVWILIEISEDVHKT